MTRYNPSVKLITRFLALIVIVLCAAGSVRAQRIVSVPQGVGTLNEAVLGDTTETGERVDLNTIYELEPNGLYLLVGTLETRFPLYIRAAAGEGDRPAIVPAVGEGGESSRPFTPRDDLRLEGLYVTNKDELGAIGTRIIRVRADSARIIIDNCHLDFDGQSAFRLDNAWNVVKVTNSVISNIGIVPDYDNGRGIDTRGNLVDSLVYDNDTFYNITSRIVRDDGGYIRFAQVTRNTIYDIGLQGLSLGGVEEAIIEDNLFINNGFLGTNDTTVTGASIIDIDSVTYEEATGPQNLSIARNYFYLDPALTATFPDSVAPVQIVRANSPAYGMIHSDDNVIEEKSFAWVEPGFVGSSSGIAAVPAVPSDLVMPFWVDQTAGTPVTERTSPPLDDGDGGPGIDPEKPDQVQLPFDFTYADTEPAYSGGVEGEPIGDLNWFGLVGTAVEETGDIPESYRLTGNYPNPFNPSTTISFDLPEAANVRVEIFDVTGRKVMTVAAGTLSAGAAQVFINALDAPSGTYVYRVVAETASQTKIMTGSMTLLK